MYLQAPARAEYIIKGVDVLLNSRKHLLQLIYDHNQSYGSPLQINADGTDTNSDSQTLCNDISFLEDSGYIVQTLRIARCYVLALTEKGEQFVENGYKILSEVPSSPINNIFNIENATNSVIGSQQFVTLNISNAIQKTREQVDLSNSDDKPELQQIINLLEMVVNGNVSAKEGLFSKFTSVIQRNSWITSPISSILLNWLIK